jgi:hypothetical protein
MSRSVSIMQLPKNVRIKVTNNGGDDDYRDGGVRYIKSVEFDIVEETRVIGAGRLFRINADLAYDNDESIHLICDYMQNTMDCADALYDYDTEGFSEKVDQLFDHIPRTSNVLLIDRMEIEQAHRGRMIGLIVMLKLIRRYGKGCSLVAIKPFPLQYDGKVAGQEEALERDREKLVRYYSRLGFQRIRGADFYAISLANELPTEQGLLRGQKAKVS